MQAVIRKSRDSTAQESAGIVLDARCTGRGLFGKIEEFRLGRAGIALHQDIEVATDTGILDKLGSAAKERERQGRLDLLVRIDGRLNAIDQSLGNIPMLGES
ncbi:hypothetical protein PsorP6_008939 [Peronosclerospora sorghi]|uniref:Uncharacterized protein n=1 Tax=Peronosclerospora sorghi TaxID=230839 RepID=A0ACC0VY67_9STRA|nr:hypothetical protein PsorP6_008939 [Peronosclerospora sorghi]